MTGESVSVNIRLKANVLQNFGEMMSGQVQLPILQEVKEKRQIYNQAKPWETFTKVSQPVELRFSLASLRLTTT